MKPGEVLKVSHIDNLPSNPDTMHENIGIPHQFNSTNFHFHGSHASPNGFADIVMRSMQPGKTCDIAIELPKDHTRGTYWSHPHHHGSAVIRSRFLDYAGAYMLPCHMMNHEEMGMMQTVEVYKD